VNVIRPATAFVASLLVVGCAVSTVRRKPLPEEQEEIQRAEGKARVYERANDAPEISRSAGAEGTVVVLWPRIVPKSDDAEVVALAEKIQSKLGSMATAAGAKSLDKRPVPERVCPRPQGCVGPSLTAVVAMKGAACAVTVVVGPPGPSDLELLPLVGGVDLKQPTVPFREPPENALSIVEFAKCSDLRTQLEENAVLPGQVAVEARLRKLLGS
jgi:hypothetical protein